MTSRDFNTDISGTDKIEILTKRTSWSKKKANNFKWCEDMADYWDYYQDNKFIEKRKKKFKVNYDLYNGRGIAAGDDYEMNKYLWNLDANISSVGSEGLRHYDVISQIAKAMVGEQVKRPFKPVIIDTSRYATNLRKKKRNELIKDYFNEKVISPMQQNIMMQYDSENGITDQYSLQPEQRQQRDADIQGRLSAMVPSEIQNFIANDFNIPSEKMGQQIIDFLSKKLDLKWVTNEGFKHMLITGIQVYGLSIQGGKPIVDLVNPEGFDYFSSNNTFFIEDADAARYEQQTRFMDIMNKYGDKLTEADLKKLERNYIGGSSNSRDSIIDAHLVSVVSNHPGGFGADVRTIEGQEQMKGAYSALGKSAKAFSTVREVDLVYKALDKMKYIVKYNAEKDTKYGEWYTGNYTFNRDNGDIEEHVAWIPRVYRTRKLGLVDPVYVDKGLVPYQHISNKDPFDCKLPYFGMEQSKLMGNSENVSHIDLGKPYQYKFNIKMSQIEEKESRDIGKVILGTLDAKPKDWTWEQFFETIRVTKYVPLDLSGEGVSPQVASTLFKSVDLSTTQQLLADIQYLEFIRNQVAVAMSYNPSRLGQISPYLSATNNQQNIIQSSNQTEDIFVTHNKIVENMLNGLLNMAVYAYKKNPPEGAYFLDDLSKADLELDNEVLDRSKLALFVSTDPNEHQNLQQVKELLHSLVQNQLITFGEMIKILWSNSGAEMMDLAKLADKRMQQQQQSAAEAASRTMEAEVEMKERLLNLEYSLKRLLQTDELLVKQAALEVEKTKYSDQYDINKNNQNDFTEQTDKEIIYKKDKDTKELAFKKEELKVKREIELKKIKNSSAPKK